MTVFPGIALLTILSIAAITIIIAIFAFIHIYTIGQNTKTRLFIIIYQIINKLNLVLAGIVSPADLYTEVGHTGNETSIRHHTDRGSI